MLLAVKIWATAHLLANGDLGSILLFGGFLAWAVAARISAKRRALTAGRRWSPSTAARGGPAGWRNDVIAVVVGVGRVVRLRALPPLPLLIGVPVWPGQA